MGETARAPSLRESLYSVLFLAARSLYGSQHGFGFIFGLFEFALGIGVGYDSRPGLQICFAAFHEKGADRDAGIQIARKIGVEDGSAIHAAPRWLQLFDDLHGANFGRAAEHARGEARRERIH